MQQESAERTGYGHAYAQSSDYRSLMEANVFWAQFQWQKDGSYFKKKKTPIFIKVKYSYFYKLKKKYQWV